MKKIQEIKSRPSGSGTLDNRLPATSQMKHLQMRQKQKSMKAQRNNEIASENRMLLKKIAKIITTIPQEMAIEEPNNKSLNAKGRTAELGRISKENQKILHRMLAVRSQHDIGKLKKEAAHHEKLLKRLRMVKYKPRDASMSEGESVQIAKWELVHTIANAFNTISRATRSICFSFEKGKGRGD